MRTKSEYPESAEKFVRVYESDANEIKKMVSKRKKTEPHSAAADVIRDMVKEKTKNGK